MSPRTGVLRLADLEAFDRSAPAGGLRRRFLCPLCGGEKPRDGGHRSLSLEVPSGLWQCFRCHNKGRLREFWQPQGPLSRRRAVTASQALATSRRLLSGDEQAQAWMSYWNTATPLSGTAGAAYIEARGLPIAVAEAAGLRYHESFFGRGAVLFPITDRSGNIVAVSGRYCDVGSPKSRCCGPKLLGLFTTTGALDARLMVITEAPIDALTLSSCGIPAMALCGTTAPFWLPTAAAFKQLALALDADTAGDAAGDSLGPALTSYGARVTRWRPTGVKDWNEALQHGAGLPCWYCAGKTPSLYTPSTNREASGRFHCDSHGPDGDPCSSEDRIDVPAEGAREQAMLSAAFAPVPAPSYHEPLRKVRKR